MSISTTKTKVIYQGDGQNRRFEIPFPFLSVGDVRALLTDQNGAETDVSDKTQIDTSRAFLIYPKGEEAPLPQGARLTLYRQTLPTQENDLIQQAVLHKESLEKSLDKLTMIAQEVCERLTRTVAVGVTDEASPTVETLISDMRALYGDILKQTDITREEAQKAIKAAVEAYEQAEKLYATVEYYDAGTPSLNYDGGLTEVKLNESYKADGCTLKVFVNGKLLRQGVDKDYVEVVSQELAQSGDDYGDTVRFNTPLTAGDQLVFMFSDTLTMPGGEVAQQAAMAAQQAQQSAADCAKSAEAAKASAETFVPKQIGEVYQSQSALPADNAGALPAWTGQRVEDAKTYWPALYKFVAAHPELQKTKAEYEELLAKNGEVPFYIKDDEADGNLRLPTLKRHTASSGALVTATAPDWSKTKDAGRSGTVSQDGYLLVYSWNYGEGYGQITINGVTFPLNKSNRSKHNNGSANATFLRVKKNDTYALNGYKDAVTMWFVPCLGLHEEDNQYNYPWVVAANAIEGMIKHNGGFITVQTYTRDAWDALVEKPTRELSLIEEEIK